MSTQRPTSITADRTTRKMSITWGDGHESYYAFSLLRNACPCAECRGGHANMSSEPDTGVFDMPDVDLPTTRLSNVEAVGGYAITLAWEDGHHFGIYTWHYLRALCACAECRPDNYR